MLCWMCGKTRRDRIINDNVRERELGYYLGKMEETSLRVFVQVGRIPIDSLVRRVDKMEDSQITKGRRWPRKTIRETIK